MILAMIFLSINRMLTFYVMLNAMSETKDTMLKIAIYGDAIFYAMMAILVQKRT
jgi:hypothetical protein